MTFTVDISEQSRAGARLVGRARRTLLVAFGDGRLTLEELAEGCEISVDDAEAILNGEKDLTVYMYGKMAALLGLEDDGLPTRRIANIGESPAEEILTTSFKGNEE